MEVINRGKTKEVLGFKEPWIAVKIESKPEITAGDGKKRDTMTGKDFLANNTTCNVFEMLRWYGVLTHYICRADINSFWAYACKMIPIEVVGRRKADGSYLDRNPEIEKGTKFNEIVIEFFLKDDKRHDPIIVISEGEWRLHKPKEEISPKSFLETIKPLLSEEEVAYIKEQTRKTFLILEEVWWKLGVELIDFKIEFGRREDNREIVIADVIDNDGLRIHDIKTGRILDKDVYRKGGPMEEVEDVYQTVSEMSNLFPFVEIEIEA